MVWLLWLGLVLCLMVVAAVGLSAYGARRWAVATQALMHSLEAGRIDDKRDRPSPPARYDARELDGLPAPVQRYFRSVLMDGQPIIAAVIIDIAGTFNMSATGEQWKPFTVRWEAVDDRSANATIVDGPLTLTLLFRFNDAGLIGSFRAEARGGMVGNKMVMAPWEGNWSNYQVRNGVMLPLTGEVAWMRPEGRRPYFVGTVTSLKLEFSP